MASSDDEILSTRNLGTSNEVEIGELLNVKAPAIATAPATASAPTTAPDTDIEELLNALAHASAPAKDIGVLLNANFPATAPAFYIGDLLDATPSATASVPALSSQTDDLSEHFLNDLFNIDSQTSTSSTSSSWSPGPASVLPNSSSLTPSSPRKRTNSSNCGGPETKQRRLSSESESAPGGSKPNTNKKENDRLIAENDAMMKLRKKDILDMWTMIKMQDVWLACKRGLEFDSVRSNFSEFLVSDFSYRKIMADEQDAEHKASELEAFRKDRKNRDKRKDVIMRQKDVIKGQEEVLRQLKSLSQDLDIRV